MQLHAVYAALKKDARGLEEASAVLLAQVRSHPAQGPLDVKQTYEWSARLMLEELQQVPAQEQCLAKLNLGILYLQMKLYPTADALFAASMGCVPEPLVPRHAAMWSEALLELNRGLEAVNMLQPLLEKHGDVLDLPLSYARALAKIGRIPEAREQYEKLKLHPAIGTVGLELVESELKSLS